ncbi:branched-chain amino acid ABC transporter permease, partial [Halobacteriales archaeon QS_1_68_44]
VALAVGAVSFRLTGVYFAMVTLGFAEVAHVFVRNWDYVGSNPRDGAAVTGREGFAVGYPGLPADVRGVLPDVRGVFPEVLARPRQVRLGRLTGDSFENVFGLGIDLGTAEVSYYAVGAVVLVCYFVMQRIIHSPFGRVMVAIRENEERAEAVGYNTFWYKLGAFGVSGFFGAVAGGLLAGYRRSVAPEFTLLEFINVFVDGRADLYLGVVFVLFVLFVPRGLLGTLRERLGGTVAEKLPERLDRYRR